jgi:hypothetical protein
MNGRLLFFTAGWKPLAQFALTAGKAVRYNNLYD